MKPKLGGIDATAEMLNLMDPESQKRLLLALAERDPALVEKLRGAMFTFADVFKLDAPIVRDLLREIPIRSLATALRGATPEVMSSVLQHMASRAQDTLREEMDSLGPQPKKVIEDEQHSIVNRAKKFKFKE